jgi:hypothetical protein
VRASAPQAPLALVASESEALARAIEAAGYTVEVSLAPDATADALAKEPVVLVACDESTDPRIAEHLRTLPGRRRRDLFVLIVAADCRTGDRFAAWCRSANLVVHPDDVHGLSALLAERKADDDAFYERFRALSREVHQVLGSY